MDLSDVFRMLMLLSHMLIICILLFRYIFSSEEKNSNQSSSDNSNKSIPILIFSIAYISFSLLNGISEFEKYPNYYEQIERNSMYTPFATDHLLSLRVYSVLYFLSILAIVVRRGKLPPLALSLCIVFVIIGTVLQITVLLQFLDVTWNKMIPHINFPVDEIRYIKLWHNNTIGINGVFAGNTVGNAAMYRIMNLFLSLYIIITLIRQEKNSAMTRRYKNKFLNKLNSIIAKHYFICAFILLIPLFTIITIILLLFGQEPDSMVKVWTETTTWTFSKHDHPPYLEYKGHYLCTVAACGHPKIVKPLQFGMRHRRIIIVNRQLQVANDFEEMIAHYFPAFHRI